MQNQNKSVMNIDDREKDRKGIEEMLDRMSNIENDSCDKFQQDKNKRESA